VVPKDIFQGNSTEVSEELIKSDFGSHFAIIYPDLITLREMYSHYIKSVLSKGNEIVMVLPFLETVYNVRRILSENSANINVSRYEKEQLLLIMDSLKGFFGSPDGLLPFLNQTVAYASKIGKNGLSVLGDVGSFFYSNEKDGLLEYESTLSSKYRKMNYMKGFCMYSEQDFSRRLDEDEQQRLIRYHTRTMKLLSPLNGA
jgi:MEDS: MEthanogen/methylotroph, DcmR Sensory domain